MGWTNWRKIAEKGTWCDEELDHDGPACYELAIGGPRGGDIRPVYVGETVNERTRVIAYASHGSHLADIIASHLRRGWSLYYRAQARPSKRAAKGTQDRLLKEFEYDWNILMNR
jgi:GIY-YIG catalytic domain-containing protein